MHASACDSRVRERRLRSSTVRLRLSRASTTWCSSRPTRPTSVGSKGFGSKGGVERRRDYGLELDIPKETLGNLRLTPIFQWEVRGGKNDVEDKQARLSRNLPDGAHGVPDARRER